MERWLPVKKKGMSTTEFAREFSANQKSSGLFKRKTPEAMHKLIERFLTNKPYSYIANAV